MSAPESKARLWIVHGIEKRQPADVVEMCVTQQDIGVHRHAGRGQRRTEFT
jgi:hypothetical protein